MYVRSLLALALAMGACLAVPRAEPIHAQCKVIWLFGIPCHDVYVAVVSQIKTWMTRASCESGGENCLYELVSLTPYLVKAKHTSPTTTHVNDLQFALAPTEDKTMCRVTGDSESESWADLFNDNGSNYCCIYNLIEGSGLTKVSGYKQYTNDWICLEFSTANCTIV